MPNRATASKAAEKLQELLDFLSFWTKDDSGSGGRSEERARVPDIRRFMEGVLGQDGVHVKNKRRTQTRMGDALEELRAGNLKAFFLKLGDADLNWLRVPERASVRNNASLSLPGDSQSRLPRIELDSKSRRRASWERTAMYLAEAICPWDYDRREPSFTFVSVWTDVEAIKTDRDSTKVKVTSTIKPIHQEWKLTARNKLMTFGEDGILIGKAGIFLVGDKDPYVGLEADRTWQLPTLPGTRLFLNANYRSSRKPDAEPVEARIGIQHTFRVRDGLELTLRAGASSQNGAARAYFAPIPFGSYY